SFFVHQNLITSCSHFFAKALKKYGKDEDGDNMWLEGEEGVIKMPTDEPTIFANYLQLIYRGYLPIGKSIDEDISTMSETEGLVATKEVVNYEYVALSKLHVFCEKVRDTQAKASVIIAFLEASLKKRHNGCTCSPEAATITIIFGGTMAGDPLRELCADWYALQADNNWFQAGTAAKYHPEFVFDV
ncbi:hypothetical protein EK21DRAFT_22923, partial [Setomelanomma holmii]